MSGADEVIQVVLHPTLRDGFERWLTERGLCLFRMPAGEDDLPTYGTTFKDPPPARPHGLADRVPGPPPRPTRGDARNV